MDRHTCPPGCSPAGVGRAAAPRKPRRPEGGGAVRPRRPPAGACIPPPPTPGASSTPPAAAPAAA
eukprot:9497592-Pyramimonas_sp.AAC.1